MSYGSILVHLGFDDGSKARLQYATDLAGDLGAYLIGFGAATGGPFNVGTRSAEGVPDHLNALKRLFFSVAGGGSNSGWRAVEDQPTRALVENARAVDLVVAGTPEGEETSDVCSRVEPGELACGCGRPVLFVAEGAEFLHPRRVLIGWKDTPEARRAVLFALPFLRLAEKIVVVAFQTGSECRNDIGATDTVRYLARHNLDARSMTIDRKDSPEVFLDAVRDQAADLVVAGARGYMGERLLGGVTGMLLAQNGLNRLMAG